MLRICFVCLGNICRSPTAEGVMQHLIEQAGLADRIELDSAGTGAYHVGEKPDRRSAGAALRRGIQLRGCARQFERSDFDDFDYVVAMDSSNHRDLLALCRSADDRGKVSLLRDFDPASPRGASVPDPYFGGERGFDEVLDICQAACEHLLARLRREHGL
jgi:protein-tyrosine phosphatase